VFLTERAAPRGTPTLHQLRHSAIPHLAEAGVSTVLLMAKGRHRSRAHTPALREPKRELEAVARLTAEHDPNRRRYDAPEPARRRGLHTSPSSIRSAAC